MAGFYVGRGLVILNGLPMAVDYDLDVFLPNDEIEGTLHNTENAARFAGASSIQLELENGRMVQFSGEVVIKGTDIRVRRGVFVAMSPTMSFSKF